MKVSIIQVIAKLIGVENFYYLSNWGLYIPKQLSVKLIHIIFFEATKARFLAVCAWVPVSLFDELA
jgi:hypothetical protein